MADAYQRRPPVRPLPSRLQASAFLGHSQRRAESDKMADPAAARAHEAWMRCRQDPLEVGPCESRTRCSPCFVRGGCSWSSATHNALNPSGDLGNVDLTKDPITNAVATL